MDITALTDRELLEAHCKVMEELRTRGVVRSSNNPVADYTETIVARALGAVLESNSKAGYDAVSPTGVRYQIKGRRLTSQNTNTQLSAIRNLDKAPFDALVPVVYDKDLVVQYAAIIPLDLVRRLGKFYAHTNSTIFHFRRSVLQEGGVVDITHDVIEAAQ